MINFNTIDYLTENSIPFDNLKLEYDVKARKYWFVNFKVLQNLKIGSSIIGFYNGKGIIASLKISKIKYIVSAHNA